jgi:uncharacterized membrane protein
VWLVAAAYVAIRFWNLTTFALDSDEIFSLLTARHSLPWLLHAVRMDVVHPPLSYLLLGLWTRIGGESLLWVRLLPCLLSILALVPLWIIFRQLELSAPARIIALAMLAINDFQVFHARYVRMYALLFLLSLASIAAYQALLGGGTRKRWIALTAINLLLVYTHYYGWMVIAVEGLHLLWMDRRKLKLFVLSTSIIALLFAPWAVAVAQTASAKGGLAANLGWIRHPKINDLFWYYTGCDGPLSPVAAASTMMVLLFAVLAVGLPRVFRAAAPLENSLLRFIALLAAFPALATLAISNMLRNSVWGNRHLVVSLIPYLILVAAALVALRPKWVRAVMIGIVAVWVSWGAYRVTMRPDPRNNLDVLSGQLAALNAREAPQAGSATVYFLDPYLSFPMRYFLEAHYGQKWNLVDVPNAAAISGDRVWVAYNYKSWTNRERPQDLLRARGYQIGPGVWAADHWDRIAVFLAFRPRR